MAELQSILSGGTITDMEMRGFDIPNVDETAIAAALLIAAALAADIADGLNMPQLADDTAASNNSVYWNIAETQLEYKDPSGVVKKFALQNP